MAAIQTQLLTGLQALIVNLNLQGTTGATGNIGNNVFKQLLGETLNIDTWPAVLLLIEGETEEEQNESENFEEDGVTYPVKILICDPMRPTYQQALDDYVSWRHAIGRALRDKLTYPLLPTTPEWDCSRIRVRNMPIIPAELKTKQFVVAGLVALCDTNETKVRD